MKTKILRNTLLSLGVVLALAAILPVQLAGQPATAQHRRYKLIDLGTLGGPDSFQVAPAKTLNNRGEFIAQSTTSVPDPYCPNCFSDDGFVTHPILREPNGVIIDLGGPAPAPGGLPNSMNSGLPTWINDNGLIAGLFENGLIDPLTGFPQFRAVLWNQNGHGINLGTLGGNSSQGNSMDSRGQVVGMALNAIPEDPGLSQFMNFVPAATQTRAFLWQSGVMQDLGTLGGNDAVAVDINESGQVLGMSYTNATVNDSTGLPTVHPFLWRNGKMRDLGSLGGTLATPGSFANGPVGVVLNERGEAIGTSNLAGDGVNHAFLWTNGTMRDLGTIGGDNSEALAINQAGQVVGRSDVAKTPFHHAFLWQNGTMTDLGVVSPCKNSTASSINSAGVIVGGMGRCTDNPNDTTFFRGFVWQHGGPIVDLNTLLSPSSDIDVDQASYISERGEIGGIGRLPNGEFRAILLVPLPGP